ncbi:Dabb family protein [Paenibacillus sp. SYP-B3998]|uniref:Dabb family protein n=1 Tax=Paenibacillus sp. SYP-B3998 TaxID=2678564 RepID=A0A6G4A6P8_9BACL|nr:Dabb family protein [Paenibacillus sp. SYP-B3998]NEW09307.1 Dabb family protein [Paenibacillus sp. SYP-B3998]
MFEHLVAFKFNENYTPALGDQLIATLMTFKGLIPGIHELTAGVNVTQETDNVRGYTLGLRVTFCDQEALSQYGPHPAHQQFVKSLDGILDNVVVIDYPII